MDLAALGLLRASRVAENADCSRRKVGAVLVDTEVFSVIAEGWNGAPHGMGSCLKGDCPRAETDVAPGSSYDTGPGTCIALHAEQKVIMRASWDDMKRAILCVSEEPCDGCMRMIVGTEIQEVHTPTRSWYRTTKEWVTWSRR